MKFKYIKYSQPGGVFYAISIPASNIAGKLAIYKRSEYPERGIQRDSDSRRVKSVAQFASGSDAVFPTPIIVSANSKLVSIEDDDYITINFDSKDEKFGHILDGQHRYLGICELSHTNSLVEFDILIVFVFEVDVYSEAHIFSVVNANQKQVSKSLMYDLFSIKEGRSPEKTAHITVRALNEADSSPFFGRVKILGKKMGDNEILSQAAIADAIVSQINSRNTIFYKFFINNEDYGILKIIINAYSALFLFGSELEKKDIEAINKLFYRTTGFGGFIKAIGDYSIDNNDFRINVFLEMFEDLFKEGYDLKIEGVGNSAMLSLKEKILKSFKNIKK